MTNNPIDSGCYVKAASDEDPINDLKGKICIVNTNNAEFCARLTAIHGENELWFTNRSGLLVMVRRESVTSIRPLTSQRREE